MLLYYLYCGTHSSLDKQQEAKERGFALVGQDCAEIQRKIVHLLKESPTQGDIHRVAREATCGHKDKARYLAVINRVCKQSGLDPYERRRFELLPSH